MVSLIKVSSPGLRGFFTVKGPLFVHSFRSLSKERLTSLLKSRRSALFPQTAGCMGSLPILEFATHGHPPRERPYLSWQFQLSTVYRSPRAGRKIVCAKRRAELRCTPFPPRGGFHATNDTASWTFLSPASLDVAGQRSANRQVRPGPGGIGSGSRVE